MLLILTGYGVFSVVPLTQAQETPTLSIAVSVTPLAGVVEQIGGEYIDITVLLPEDIEPHASTLPPEAVIAAEDADLLVLTGHFPWEESLATQVSTPYISFDDLDALENFEDYGAAFSPMPGEHEEEGTGHEHDEGNPHGWWMLPRNAIAIANATQAALSTLNSTLTGTWQSNFNQFVAEVTTFQDLVTTIDEDYGFSQMHAVAVFPAEAYVAEAFGIECEAVLQKDEVFISGGELLEVQDALRNGTINLILGSDVARLQSGGEFAYQLVLDYGGTLIWWRTVFSEVLSNYVALMTVNLGALTTGLDEGGVPVSAQVMNLALIVLSGVLGIIVLIETVLLIKRAKAE